ncbi:hypothetical protein HRbin36_02606 [bacterium HR36]|nr:hypothetical protein HRbin36_02606 [bacterium HR36]
MFDVRFASEQAIDHVPLMGRANAGVFLDVAIDPFESQWVAVAFITGTIPTFDGKLHDVGLLQPFLMLVHHGAVSRTDDEVAEVLSERDEIVKAGMQRGLASGIKVKCANAVAQPSL